MFIASRSEILSFLPQLSEHIKTYGTLNSCRSELSLTLSEDVGDEARLKILFKGYQLGNPKFWNSQPVLSFVSKLWPNAEISLEISTKKPAILIVLAMTQRV